jgi:hypothetical protein
MAQRPQHKLMAQRRQLGAAKAAAVAAAEISQSEWRA